MTRNEILWVAWAIVKFVALVLWVALRICFILMTVIFLGGFRGASRAKMSSAQKK